MLCAVGYAAPDVVSSPTASQAASLDLLDRAASVQQQDVRAHAASSLPYAGAHARCS